MTVVEVTDQTLVFVFVIVMTAPPGGAAAVNVIVPVAVRPPRKRFGLIVKFSSWADVIVRSAETSVPSRLAVMVACTVPATAVVFTVKVPVV